MSGVALVPILVLEGDWGGDIYLTVPARIIGINADPRQLLKELNNFSWDYPEVEGSDGSAMYVNYTTEFVGGKPLGLWISEKFHPERNCRPSDHYHDMSIPELAPPNFNPETQCPPQVEFTCEEVHRMKWRQRVQYYLDVDNPRKLSLRKLRELCV